MSAFDDALKNGYSSIYSITIEGIPYIFTEKDALCASTASAPSLPSGSDYVAAIPALFIDESQAISIELNRETGVAAGKSWDIILSYEALEEADVLETLFRFPTFSTDIALDVDSADTEIFVMDDASALSGSAFVYLGRECMALEEVTGITNKRLIVKRAVASEVGAYDYIAQGTSTYRTVSSHPICWKGRIVTLREHLISPEGRMIASTWGEDSWNRVIWRGYIDEPPQPDSQGFKIPAQALVRLAAQEIGYQTTFEVEPSSEWIKEGPGILNMPILISDADQVKVTITWSGTDSSGFHEFYAPDYPIWFETSYPIIDWYEKWWQSVREKIIDEVQGDPWFFFNEGIMGESLYQLLQDGTFVHRTQLHVKANFDVEILITVEPGKCYWLQSGTYSAYYGLHMPVSPGLNKGKGWFYIRITEGEGLLDGILPEKALGYAEVGGVKEIFRWDGVHNPETGSPARMIHVVERAVYGKQVNLHDGNVQIKVVNGISGAGGLMSNIVKLLESSGTGERGDYDEYSLGQGLGINENAIQLNNQFGGFKSGFLDFPGFFGYAINVLTVERTSVESLVGGWLALQQLCISQMDGKLCLVSTQVVDDTGAVEIGKADVLIDNVEVDYAVEAPNQVIIDTSGLNEGDKIQVRHTTAIQAEGTRSAEFKTPGIQPAHAVKLATSILANSQNQSIYRIELAPWMRVHPGQPVLLSLEHPKIYDWRNGSRAPSYSISGVVLGVETRLFTGTHSATILVQGDTLQYLCPSSRVVSWTHDSVTVSNAEHFAEGENIMIYDAGYEDTREVVITINEINGSSLIFDSGSVPSWVGSSSYVTFPDYDISSGRQQTFAFVRLSTSWK